MKKSLFLLPLLAAFALCGCGDNGGGTGGGGGGGGGQGGGGEGGGGDVGDTFVLDFTDSSFKDDKITPYVSDDDIADGNVLTFEYEGITFNDQGCFATSYDNNYYLMMKNKYGPKDSPSYTTHYAFIGNQTAFDKPIKKVEVEVEGSSSSANTIYRVAIGNSAAEAAVTSGGKTGKKGQTITAESSAQDGYYFSVSTNASGGKIYNGQILSITVSF